MAAFEAANSRQATRLRVRYDSVIHLNLAKACEEQLSLVLDYDDTIPHHLIGDSKRLHRIVLELVTNALKFTAKGQVSVSAVLMRDREDDVVINICVKDTGIGIASHDQPMLFNRFRRFTPAYEGKYSGLGLGLTRVKQFIEDVGGEIYFESEIQKGSTFTCVISLKKVVAASAVSPVAENISSVVRDKPSQRRMGLVPDASFQPSRKFPSILLVEDDALAAVAVEALLKSLGCAVDIAVNGYTAIEYVKNHSYDLIMMDVGLPDLSGNSVTRHIRAWESRHNTYTPIVALTAHSDTERKHQCLEAGIEAVFSKPLLKETAMHILNTFIVHYARESENKKG